MNDCDPVEPRPVPETEFSERFVQGMRDRMAVSYFKYGPVAAAYPHKVNALASLRQRLAKYEQTGNTEYLMDAANFAMIEFMHPAKKGAFYKATDSDGSPGRIDQYGDVTHGRNRDIQQPLPEAPHARPSR